MVVSSYYDGTKAIHLEAKHHEFQVSWHVRRNLRALMSQPLYRAGHVYLLDKRHGLTRIIHESNRVRRKRCVGNDLRLSFLFHTAPAATLVFRRSLVFGKNKSLAGSFGL